MNIPTVRNRNGKPSIYVPGVVLATAVIIAAYGVGVAVFSFALGWHSPLSFVGLPALIGAIVGRSIRLGLRPPVAGLTVVG
jgi:hypothetical protein